MSIGLLVSSEDVGVVANTAQVGCFWPDLHCEWWRVVAREGGHLLIPEGTG